MAEPVLVLGSNSFSGSHFCTYCLEQGDEVIGISRSAEPAEVFLTYRKLNDLAHRFSFHKLDLNQHMGEIAKILRKTKPAYVVNFASQSMVAESWEHPEHWMMTNVVSTIRLHETLRDCPFLRTYVHISTPEVYGSMEGLVREHTSYSPSTPYAVSRAAADMSLVAYYRHYGFPVVFTRAANVFGPGQQLYRVIPRTVLYFLTGRRLPLHGGGRSLRSFIHIRDVCAGTYAAMKLGRPGEIFHFSTDRNVSIRGVVEQLAQRLGVDFNQAVEITDDRPGKDAAYLLDNSKARDILDWSPRIGLEEGLDETIAWVKDNLEILLRQQSAYVHKP